MVCARGIVCEKIPNVCALESFVRAKNFSAVQNNRKQQKHKYLSI